VKLVVLKKISVKLPVGTEFDLPDRQAKMLIAIKVARAVDPPAPSLSVRRTYRRRDLVAEDSTP